MEIENCSRKPLARDDDGGPEASKPSLPWEGRGLGEGWLLALVTPPHSTLSPIGGEGKNLENSMS